MQRAVVALSIAVMLASCSGPRATPTSRAEPDFNRGTVLIDTAGDSVLMYALVAESSEQPAHASMSETPLAKDKGVVFLYLEPATAGFSLEEAAVPLSVAFFDVDGEILEIVDVGPCATGESACPSHDPGTPYVGALVVNEGAFDELGVAPGDVVEIVPGSE